LIDNERQFTYGRKAAFPVFHKPCHTSFWKSILEFFFTKRRAIPILIHIN
jgi:hypothetical protein